MDRVVARSDFSGRTGGGSSDSAGAQTSVGRVRARREILPLCVLVPRPLVPSQLWVHVVRKQTSTLLSPLPDPRARHLAYAAKEPSSTGANIRLDCVSLNVKCCFITLFSCEVIVIECFLYLKCITNLKFK